MAMWLLASYYITFMWSYLCVCHVYQYIVESTRIKQVVGKLSPRVILHLDQHELINNVSRPSVYISYIVH